MASVIYSAAAVCAVLCGWNNGVERCMFILPDLRITDEGDVWRDRMIDSERAAARRMVELGVMVPTCTHVQPVSADLP